MTCSSCGAIFNHIHDNWVAKHQELYQGFFVSSEGENLSLENQAGDLLEGGIHFRIVKRFGAFVVTTLGLENLEHVYPIPDIRFHEPDWVRHMSMKNWVNVEAFEAALEYAKSYFQNK